MPTKRRRHLERYLEVGRILRKHGWAGVLGRVGLAGLFHLRAQGSRVPPSPEQVRETLEELGPTYVKLGQLLSTRSDLLPPEYIKELATLQDAAPEVPFDDVCQVIEEEFGACVDTLFSSFDRKPLASASLGQTHLAVLPDGREVVVKVQRPGIRQVIETDMEIITGIALFLERHIERLRMYGLSEAADEMSITLHQELTYTREGDNGDALKKNFHNVQYAMFASTMWEYTTSRVLTQERLRGIKINDLTALDEAGRDRKAIARNLSKVYLKMVLVDGFFHGDPHPGNLLVQENNTVGLVDYGMMGRLDRELKTQVTLLVAEYVHENSREFAEIMLNMGTGSEKVDREQFTHDMDRLLRQYYGTSLRESRMGHVLTQAIQLSARRGLRLPSGLVLLIKVLLQVEGLGQLLDPDYNFESEASGFLDESLRGEFSYSEMRQQGIEAVLRWKRLLTEFPSRIRDIIDRAARGSLRIPVDLQGLDAPTRLFEKAANRISLGLISAASLISSALIISSDTGPIWRGLPWLGIAGFAVSAVFTVWLIVSILRAESLW